MRGSKLVIGLFACLALAPALPAQTGSGGDWGGGGRTYVNDCWIQEAAPVIKLVTQQFPTQVVTATWDATAKVWVFPAACKGWTLIEYSGQAEYIGWLGNFDGGNTSMTAVCTDTNGDSPASVAAVFVAGGLGGDPSNLGLVSFAGLGGTGTVAAPVKTVTLTWKARYSGGSTEWATLGTRTFTMEFR